MDCYRIFIRSWKSWLLLLLLAINPLWSYHLCAQKNGVSNALARLSPAEKAESLLQLAQQAVAKDPLHAQNLVLLALEEQSSPTLRSRCLLFLAKLAMDDYKLQRADSLLSRALLLTDSPALRKAHWEVQLAQAELNSLRGQQRTSLNLLNQILATEPKTGDSLIWARSLMAKGIVLHEISAYEESLHFYFQALTFFRDMSEEMRTSIVLTNIGMVFLDLQRITEARHQFQAAYEISNRLGDSEGIMINLLNLGVSYQREQKLEQANRYFKRALQLAKVLAMPMDIAILQGNLGMVALELGQLHQARQYFNRALTIKDSLNLWPKLPQTLRNLARLYIIRGQLDSALQMIERAVPLAQKAEDLDQLVHLFQNKAEIEAGLANFPAAYQSLQQHRSLSDSLFSIRRDEAISNLRVAYETTAKEELISNLAAENKKRTTERTIIGIIALLILITTSSLLYTLYMRRMQDRRLLAREQELHQERDRFFANVSHEFRTPLTLILGPAQSLGTQIKQASQRNLLQTIRKNAVRLLFLVNQIMDLSRINRQVFQLKIDRINLITMLEGVCASFHSLAADRKISYECHFRDAPIYILGDFRRLEIVLINLISNAFKFTPDSGRTGVELIGDAQEQQITIVVWDSGSGISQDKQKKIFERYFHDDRHAHSQFEGTGIGLALCKQIVDLHEGSLTVSSEVGKGSEFTLCLPWRDDPQLRPINEGEDESALPLNISFEEAEIPVENRTENPRLLVVEDNREMRDYFKSFLIAQYRVMEAANADQGWSLATKHIPDLVISDVLMPGESGVELCQKLKNDVRTSHIPVIIITARASPTDRLEGLKHQADAYITKPFNPLEVELKLKNLLDHRQKMQQHFEASHYLQPERYSYNTIDRKFLMQIAEALDQNYASAGFGVEQLAEIVNLSRSQLFRKLKALSGQTPNQLVRSYRLTRAYDMLSNNTATIAEIGYQVGFSSPAYFSKCFFEEFDCTPSEIKGRQKQPAKPK